MEQKESDLPLSMVTLIFGGLSIPLAFVAHLVSLAFVLGVLALVFGVWGTRKQSRHLLRYTPKSIGRGRLGTKLGGIGTVCAMVLWILWANNVLL